MRENKTKYAVLGILSMGPVSGYDIKKIFEKSFSYFWSESYGQIYPILKRLAGQGLASAWIEKQVGKPDRHVYELTEKGRNELLRWLTEPVRRQIGRHEILLKLVFGSQVPLADTVHQVGHFRDLQYNELKGLGPLEKQVRIQKADHPNLPYWLMAVNFGRILNEAYIRWCDETLRTLGKMEEKEKARNGGLDP